jgi:mono/diheme cytochrome c family protein
MRVGIKKWGFRVGAAALLTFAAIQLIPYGRDHDNPPVVQEPTWDSATTRRLAVNACFSCHSNETRWPWYSNVAPVSWLLQRDVDEGRVALNFSEWNREQEEASEAAETVADGEMPPLRYTLAHPQARLTEAETRALIEGLGATLGTEESDGD